MNDNAKERIIEILRSGPMCAEDLSHKILTEPEGGEIVSAIQSLIEQGIVKRYSTFVYELNTESKVCQLCGALFIGDTSLPNRQGIEVPVCDACVESVREVSNDD